MSSPNPPEPRRLSDERAIGSDVYRVVDGVLERRWGFESGPRWERVDRPVSQFTPSELRAFADLLDATLPASEPLSAAERGTPLAIVDLLLGPHMLGGLPAIVFGGSTAHADVRIHNIVNTLKALRARLAFSGGEEGEYVRPAGSYCPVCGCPDTLAEQYVGWFRAPSPTAPAPEATTRYLYQPVQQSNEPLTEAEQTAFDKLAASGNLSVCGATKPMSPADKRQVMAFADFLRGRAPGAAEPETGWLTMTAEQVGQLNYELNTGLSHAPHRSANRWYEEAFAQRSRALSAEREREEAKALALSCDQTAQRAFEATQALQADLRASAAREAALREHRDAAVKLAGEALDRAAFAFHGGPHFDGPCGCPAHQIAAEGFARLAALQQEGEK